MSEFCKSIADSYRYKRSPTKAGAFAMRHLPDHGLPLVQLKEQRRDLVVALQNRNSPVSSWELMQIAAIQQAIQAFEDVIADLDAEMEMESAAA